MADLNTWIQEVKRVSDKFDEKLSLEGEILGLNEATVKLWTSAINHPEDMESIGKRLSNLLIGTFILTEKLGIKNLEEYLQKRLTELKK